MEVTDIQTLKYIGFGGLAIFVIRELFKVIYMLIQKKKNGSTSESQYKEISRQRINATHSNVWNIKKKTEDIHDVVTIKKDGVPLIYNTGLEKAVVNLNTALGVQTEAIKLLVDSVK